MSGGTGLLLLIEAELGKPMYEIPTGDSMAEDEAKKHGAYSTLGVGRTVPQGWKDGEAIHDDLKGVLFVSYTFSFPPLLLIFPSLLPVVLTSITSRTSQKV